MPAWQCEALRRQLETAQEREVLVDAQQPMYRGEQAWVRARLRRPGMAATEQAAPQGATARGTVRATERMRARLSGAGFQITPAGWVTESAGLTREADWQWTVVPSQSGRGQKLTVTVRPVLAVGEHEVEADILSRDIEVNVDVRPGTAAKEAGDEVNSIARAWATALAGILLLLGAGAAIWRWLKRGGKEEAPGLRVEPGRGR